MAQVAGIVAVIRQLEAAGVAQHVRMDGKWQLGGYAEALDELMERRIPDRNIRRELRRRFFFLDLLDGT